MKLMIPGRLRQHSVPPRINLIGEIICSDGTIIHHGEKSAESNININTYLIYLSNLDVLISISPVEFSTSILFLLPSIIQDLYDSFLHQKENHQIHKSPEQLLQEMSGKFFCFIK